MSATIKDIDRLTDPFIIWEVIGMCLDLIDTEDLLFTGILCGNMTTEGREKYMGDCYTSYSEGTVYPLLVSEILGIELEVTREDGRTYDKPLFTEFNWDKNCEIADFIRGYFSVDELKDVVRLLDERFKEVNTDKQINGSTNTWMFYDIDEREQAHWNELYEVTEN